MDIEKSPQDSRSAALEEINGMMAHITATGAGDIEQGYLRGAAADIESGRRSPEAVLAELRKRMSERQEDH